MALTELVNALRQQAIKQREREGELLNNIAYLAGLETAEAAADIALEAVDSCADADAIIKYYRGGTA